MRAARVNALDGRVTVEEVADPRAEPGHVVVDIEAAAVNYADLLIARGEYQLRADPPFTPGSELAGRVRELGDGVSTWRVGDRVVGSTLVGAFAEQATLPAAALSAVPDGVDARSAAAFLVAYGTSYPALRSVAELASGETVAVLGAAGGVGLAAVQCAHALGARVIAAASSAEKLAVCAAHGADELIDYSREDLKARLKELTRGRGVDVVVDPVGGSVTEPALRATAYGGRFVVVGFASGEIPRIPLNLVLLKGMQIRSFEIWSFRRERPDDAARGHAEMMQLLADGVLVPHVSSVHPLDDVTGALAEVGERRATGKVIIEP